MSWTPALITTLGGLGPCFYISSKPIPFTKARSTVTVRNSVKFCYCHCVLQSCRLVVIEKATDNCLTHKLFLRPEDEAWYEVKLLPETTAPSLAELYQPTKKVVEKRQFLLLWQSRIVRRGYNIFTPFRASTDR